MANPTLTVNIGANTAGLQNAQSALSSFAGTVTQTTNTSNRNLNNLGTTAQNTFSRVSNSSNRAGEALTNLGRVAQDAPFGFVSIQNNLNPLLESFQRLQRETGSTGGALRALGSSLIGPGGLGFALSIVSSAITLASIGFGAWTRGFSNNKKEVDENKKALEEFNKTVHDAEVGALSASLKLQAFVDIARDGNAPLSQRNTALMEANKLLGEHGEKLTLVNINTKAVTDEVNKFTKAMIAQAVAARYSNKIADLLVTNEETLKKYNEAVAKFKSPEIQRTRLMDNLGYKSDFTKASEAVDKLAGEYNARLKEIAGYQGDFNKLVAESTKIFGDLGTSDKTGKTDAEKRAEAIAEALAKLKADRKALSIDPLIRPSEKAMQEIGLIESTIKRLIELKVDPNGTVIQKLLGDIRRLNSDQLVKEIQQLLYETSFKLSTSNVGVQVKITPTVDKSAAEDIKQAIERATILKEANKFGISIPVTLNNDQALKRVEEIKERLRSMGNFIITNVGGAFQSVFEQVLSGGTNVFEAFGQIVKRLVVQLIAAAGAAALLSVLLGGTTIGASLFSGGASFKNIFGSMIGVKLAKGGIADRPTRALIGEYPGAKNNPEVVAPLSKLQSMLDFGNNNNMGEMVLRTEVSGDNLALLVERANRRRNR